MSVPPSDSVFRWSFSVATSVFQIFSPHRFTGKKASVVSMPL